MRSAVEARNGSAKMTSGEKAHEASGATAAFPYDRMTVEHFRQNFPRARWSDDRKAWFIPGKTADRRFQKWLAREFAGTSAYADVKGRDAYVFDPIVSKYLTLNGNHLEVQTPYSRTVVEQLRQVPFAAWDAERRVWTIPFRSYDELRRRWDQIETAAQRNEPEERRKRQVERSGSDEAQAARTRANERRRRRYPIHPDDLPPLDRPVMTAEYSIVLFTGCDGEPVDSNVLEQFYPGLPSNEQYVWGQWRPASFDELIKTWPAKFASVNPVWRQPNIDELRAARKAARLREQRQKSA